ncbi:DUF6968 family protein [Tenacibaculum sp. C7A-26P2]|uniref:DUF6968 family protein n=1 Tax=Tenacibaculum sp. C7A-26P2 TaxID=3447504 RepID=UPI003F82E9AA
MVKSKLGEIIAERKLELSSAIGEEYFVIRLGKPRPCQDSEKNWECPVELNGRVVLAFGIDSYQALLMAFQIISIEKDSLKAEKKHIFKWLGMDDLGLDI